MKSLKEKYNYCTKPWQDLHIYEDGSVSPCCLIQDKNFYNGPLKDYFSKSESLLKLKKDFKEGVKSNYCKTCWKLEKLGLPSQRTFSSQKNIHIRLSNKCNFKCRMCSNVFSSAWQKENDITNFHENNYQMYDNIFDDRDNLLFLYEYIKSSENISISLSGGEPLISNSHLKLLIFLIKTKKTDVVLNYNTNLSTLTYKGVYFPTLWSKFKYIHLFISCDGYGISNNYSRKGFIWDTFDKNLKKLIENKEYLFITLHCILNLYSIYSLPELCMYAEEHGIKIKLGYCFRPTILNPQILPLIEKTKITHKYYKFFQKLNSHNRLVLEDALRFLSNNTVSDLEAKTHRDTFIDWNKRLDNYRKENFLEYNSELKDWYEWNYK